MTRKDGTVCEAVLWDLAGQPDYRFVHSLFVDDADLALVLFNLTERQDPLHGVDFWLRALSQRPGGACSVILVGARLDRGSPTLTAAEVDLIYRRLLSTEKRKKTVYPVLLDGTEGKSLPPLLRGRVYADFRKEAGYLTAMLDLILSIYRLPFDEPFVAGLRGALRRERLGRLGR
ncbi:MAG: hypothetical protein GY842_24835 [bacterium]|nr:hypothetical protein [bacterium]